MSHELITWSVAGSQLVCDMRINHLCIFQCWRHRAFRAGVQFLVADCITHINNNTFTLSIISPCSAQDSEVSLQRRCRRVPYKCCYRSPRSQTGTLRTALSTDFHSRPTAESHTTYRVPYQHFPSLSLKHLWALFRAFHSSFSLTFSRISTFPPLPLSTFAIMFVQRSIITQPTAMFL